MFLFALLMFFLGFLNQSLLPLLTLLLSTFDFFLQTNFCLFLLCLLCFLHLLLDLLAVFRVNRLCMAV